MYTHYTASSFLKSGANINGFAALTVAIALLFGICNTKIFSPTLWGPYANDLLCETPKRDGAGMVLKQIRDGAKRNFNRLLKNYAPIKNISSVRRD